MQLYVQYNNILHVIQYNYMLYNTITCAKQLNIQYNYMYSTIIFTVQNI